MKFKKSDLITRIDNLLHNIEGEAITSAEKHEADLIGSRDAWLEDNREGFRKFARTINSRLNNGEPVTSEDIPESIKNRQGYGRTSLDFYVAPSKARSENARYGSLKKLRDALQASEDESVSPTAIKQLGFQDVTFLFTPEASE